MANDICGVYGKNLTEEVVVQIGRAFGTYIGGAGKKLVVAGDVRLSGEAL